MMATEDMVQDPRYNKVLNAAIDTAQPSSEEKWKQSQLAFSSGTPDDNGSMGSVFSSGSKAQLAQKNKSAELQATYLPTILESINQQQQLLAQQAMMRRMMSGENGGYINSIASKYHIAPEAVTSDMLFNGGKNIREMIYKNSTPELSAQDGFMADKNPATNGYMASQQPGQPGSGGLGQPGQSQPGQGVGQPGQNAPMALPGIVTSANGQSLVRIPDATAPGGFRVVAPGGALTTYKGYQDAENRSKAGMDLQTVTPAGEQPQTGTREDLVDAVKARRPGGQGGQGNQGGGQGGQGGMGQPPVGGQPAAVRGSFVGSPDKIMADIDAANVSPAIKDQMRQAYAAQAGGTNPPYNSMGNASELPPGEAQNSLEEAKAGYSAAIDARDPTKAAMFKTRIDQLSLAKPTVGMPIQSPAEAERQKIAVETEQKNFAGNLGEMRKAQTSIRQLDSAIKMLNDQKNSPTASGMGAMVDDAGAFFGKSVAGAPQADALRTTQGWLTSNVPRMEGPQSDFDVVNYQQMTGLVGNAKLPIATRLAAAEKARQLIMDAAPKEFGTGFSQGMAPGSNKASPGGGAAPSAMPTLDDIIAEKKRRAGGK